MIDWVDAKCRVWGFAKRRINGTPNLEKLKDGTIPSGNAKSFAGRVKDEGEGAAIHSGMAVAPLEVLLGDALTVAISINFGIQAGDITDRQYEVGYSHYVLWGDACRKWRRLKLKRRDYYDTIHAFHIALNKWIPSIEDRREKLKEVVGL